MVALINPQRWEIQPAGSLDIDRMNSLAEGLVVAVVGSDGSASNLANGKRFTKGASARQSRAHFGLVWDNASANQHLEMTDPGTVGRLLGSSSAMVVFSSTYNIGGWRLILGAYYGNGGSAPYNVHTLSANGSDFPWAINTNVAGSSTPFQTRAGNIYGPSSGHEYRCVSVIDRAANTVRSTELRVRDTRGFFELLTTSAGVTSNATQQGTTDIIKVGDAGAWGNSGATGVALGLMWERALTPSEQREITQRPYQLFKESPRRTFYLPAATTANNNNLLLMGVGD